MHVTAYVRFAIARLLSDAGATVILACRRADAGEQAARRIDSSTSGRCIFVQCDLSLSRPWMRWGLQRADVATFCGFQQPNHLLERFYAVSICNTSLQFVASFLRLQLPLHLLFCNAGQMLSPFCYHTLAANGYEQQFAANHLGHFHLVNRLLSVMLASSSSTCARKCFHLVNAALSFS